MCLLVNASGGAAGANAGTGGEGGASAAPSACAPEASLAPTRVLLLSDQQFKNAVRDLFGVDVTLAAAAPAAAGSPQPSALERATITTAALAQQYRLAARQVAQGIEPCGALSAACIQEFLAEKLPQAWRRPVEPAELASILALFEAGLKVSAEAALEVVMSAVLESGSFLYRTELGEPAAPGAATTTLTRYELAAAIGFAYLDSIPDSELWATAVDGSLTQPEVLAAQADRLLALPRVRDNLRRKVSSYLGLEELSDVAPTQGKAPEVFPGYSANVRRGLYEGSQQFLDELLWQGRFGELFSSKRLYLNREIAAFYGIPGVQGDALRAVDFDADQRGAGILTQPAFLSATNHHQGTDDISHRGAFVWETFTCPEAEPPPHAVSGDDLVLGPGSSQMQWRDLNSQPACEACHGLFDPYGFALQAYDAVGRYRTADETGAPIDTTATVRGFGPELDGPIQDINDVAAQLAAGRRASDCAALKLTSYTLDHAVPRLDMPCAVTAAQDELATNGTFSGLFKAIITSPGFLIRELEAP